MEKNKFETLLSRSDEREAYENYAKAERIYVKNLKNIIDKEELHGIISILKKYSLLKGQIIDIGAGTGQLIKQLLKCKKKFSIDALDTSFNLLKYVTEIKDKRIHRIIRASFYNTGLKDKNYDLIVSNFSLNYSEDIKKSFDELARILKRKGCLLFSSVVTDKPSANKNKPVKINSVLKTKFGDIPVYAHQRTEKEIINYLKKTGFKPIKLSKKDYFLKYSPNYFVPDSNFKKKGIKINTFIALAKKV